VTAEPRRNQDLLFGLERERLFRGKRWGNKRRHVSIGICGESLGEKIPPDALRPPGGRIQWPRASPETIRSMSGTRWFGRHRREADRNTKAGRSCRPEPNGNACRESSPPPRRRGTSDTPREN
jgi:hypothetical protein